MTKKVLISIRNLSKSFGDNHVLKDVNLDIYEGESLVVIGGSGTGKSVLLKCLIGLMEPDSGEILVNGQDILKTGRKARADFMERVSMLFQGSALFDSLPVWENVAFGPLQKTKVARKDAKALAIEKLATVGMDAHVADLFPSDLSGGMKRRVALARAIIEDPEIIFFDEPTAGLDPIFSGVINKIILKCIRDLGATGITITHDMNSVRDIADRVAMIHKGQIQWIGSAKQINDAENPYINQFVNGLADGPIDVVKT